MERLWKPEGINILKGQVGRNGWNWVMWLQRTLENAQEEILCNMESVHMLQGLGSIILMWQRLFQLKKLEEVMVQAHAASLQEYADHLTGLGDSPLETLMVTVLLISLQESYTPLIISLNTHPDRMKFDFVVQHCINEKARQLSITS